MNHKQSPAHILSPEQCRAARAVLKVSVEAAGVAAGVAKNTVVKFEAGGETRAATAERLRAAFEARGLTFAPDGNGLAWPLNEAPS